MLRITFFNEQNSEHLNLVRNLSPENRAVPVGLVRLFPSCSGLSWIFLENKKGNWMLLILIVFNPGDSEPPC